MYKLYGVPLSQPVRSVAWTMLQLGVPFEFTLAVPGMSSKIGTKHEQFLSLTPWKSSTVPVLVRSPPTADSNNDGSSSALTLSESPAIMSYLCERYGHNNTTATPPDNENEETLSLYIPPVGSDIKALQDVYLHWHHSNTRMVAGLFQRQVRPDLASPEDDDNMEQYRTQLHAILTNLDQGWLNHSSSSSSTNTTTTNHGRFITGSSQPTIADLLAYSELCTVTMTNLLPLSRKNENDNEKLTMDDYPNLSLWMDRMSTVPYHDEVHCAVTTLGDLSSSSLSSSSDEKPVPLAKRLGDATKIGVKALMDVQQTNEFQQQQ